MAKSSDYTVNADGWIAGKWRARGTILSMTAVAAKYENVSRVVIGVDLASGDSETITTKIAPKTAKRKSSKK